MPSARKKPYHYPTGCWVFFWVQTHKVSHNCCLHLHFPTNAVSPIPIQDLRAPSPHPGLCVPEAAIALVRGFCLQSHHLAQQQNQRDNTAEYHSVSLCRAVLLAITPSSAAWHKTWAPTMNRSSNHIQAPPVYRCSIIWHGMQPTCHFPLN